MLNKEKITPELIEMAKDIVATATEQIENIRAHVLIGMKSGGASVIEAGYWSDGYWSIIGTVKLNDDETLGLDKFGDIATEFTPTQTPQVLKTVTYCRDDEKPVDVVIQ